jgi:hypothetical protein
VLRSVAESGLAEDEPAARRGHQVAHEVADKLKGSALSGQHVVVHVEAGTPAGGGN